jgi:tight adherence protein C
MLDLITDKLSDPHFLMVLLIAVAAAASVLTVAMPLLESDTLGTRMKAVALERDRIRTRERERLNKAVNAKGSLRAEPKAYMASIVEQFSLSKWLGTEKAKSQLAMAGFRGPQAEIGFLFFRLVTPIGLALFSAFYIFVVLDLDYAFTTKIAGCFFAAYLGVKLPELYLRNAITKRRKSLNRAFPDTLDLLLICVESGMSVEAAFRKVSTEIGTQSVPMAEELTLTTAELSYLPDRRAAYDNLAARTGTESIRSLITVLVQAERYGTPLGAAMRVLSQESRDARMSEAEKKAAALPPKLTVPMVLFFLPVLFIIIATPAVVQVLAANK